MSYNLLASGYSSTENESIILYNISDKGKFIKKLWSENIVNPSFLSVYNDLLFAFSELDDSVCLYSYKIENNTVRKSSRMELQGGALCHISYSPKYSTLLGACYTSGHVFSVSVNDNKLNQLCSHIKQGDKIKDEITRAHCIIMDNQQKYLYAVNIALDRVYIYTIRNGYLTSNKEFEYLQLKDGEGPRHIKFHPNKDIAYIITEYSNKIFVVDYNQHSGELGIIQEISTLPEDFNGESFCSTLCFSKDTRYLYSANRGANTIAVFEIHADGTVIKKYDDDCCGDWPRHIDITNDGKFLLVANQNTNELVIKKLDKDSGKLLETTDKIEFEAPSFVYDYIQKK